MLYLLKDGEHYKVGYSTNMETLIKRIKNYKTHNPTFKYLGFREGTKKEEKHYHKLLGCPPKSEWVCNIKEELIENIKLDFNMDGYLESLLLKLKETYDNVQNGINIWRWGRDNNREWNGFSNNWEFKKYTIRLENDYIINEELFKKEQESIKNSVYSLL